MKMSNVKRNFCEAFSLCYISATVTYSLHMSAILFRKNSEKSYRVYQAPKRGSDTLGTDRELCSALERASGHKTTDTSSEFNTLVS